MRALLLATLVLGCDGYDQDLGPAPFLCGAVEPRCPADYTCLADPATGTEICSGSRGSNNFGCADDSAHEPNDVLAMASMTPLDAMKTFSLDGLAICPAGDKDTFSIHLGTTGESVEIVVQFEADGAQLSAALLNQGGVPIATSAVTTELQTMVRTSKADLSAGTYFAQIAGPSMGASRENNYKVTINITGP